MFQNYIETIPSGKEIIEPLKNQTIKNLGHNKKTG
jgi:hypothetical protein